ncbi:NlpC/P60 family protein [Streptomyces sp. NPDC059816]|uniref:C40 family peptidase n=1 Tax=Streptomyces sp. NPDC059816 TaxID=3346960 RepID=UPI003647794A
MRVRRILTIVVVAVACAVSLLAIPRAASAAPTPLPQPPSSGTSGSSGSSGNSGSDTPRTGADRLEDVRDRLDRLYREAAAATDAYNAAEESAAEQSRTIADLAEKIADGEERLEHLRNRAGAAARAQYRSGGIPDETRLMLSDDPGHFLDGAGRVMAGQRATKGLITQLTRTQEDLRIYAKDATANQEELEETRGKKDAARKKVERKLADAEELEKSLAAEERERLRGLEEDDQRAAQDAWLDSGVLKGSGSDGSAGAQAAIAYAEDQLGLPYEWGAEGPDSFDCSGLTQQAWAAAGVPIPRTSQQQWQSLRRVSEADLQPGDLIIYHSDASHVALYIGDGSIIHSPRPGRSVTVAGAGSMPILGVVRPES